MRLILFFSFLPLCIHNPLNAKIIPVGSGSYSTDLPTAVRPPSDANGNSVAPAKTQNITKPVTTNKWWSSLLWKRSPDNPFSENMFPHPLAVRAEPGGLGVSYPAEHLITNGGRVYEHKYAEDLLIGIAGLVSKDTKVDGFSDWAVTALWENGSKKFKATFGHGFPFIYCIAQGGDAAIGLSGAHTIWHNSNGILGITVNGHHFGIFGPSGCSWSVTPELKSSLNGKGYFSVSVLPDSTVNTLMFFARHAYVFITGSHSSWDFNEEKSLLTSTYKVDKHIMEGSETEPLLALYRHQWLHTPFINTEYSFKSPRGRMKVLKGSSFETVMVFPGVLPALPNRGACDSDSLFKYVDNAYREVNYFISSGDTYGAGKTLGKLSALVWIAEQAGHSKAKEKFLGSMKSTIENWFTASSSEATTFFYLDSVWNTLIGHPASFGLGTDLNDHHFHYGYFIMAAATIASFDSKWAQTDMWGGMVEMLIRDVANWDNTDKLFPRLRNFDSYAGHSWASGHGAFGAGNNQESSSESINFSVGVILWGEATKNKLLRDLGIFLYTNEISSAQQYWFDMDNAVFPKDFSHTTLGILWGNGGSYSTWWTSNPEEIHGINFLPFNGGSFYLGKSPQYVMKNYGELVQNNNGEESEWKDIIQLFLSLADPGLALEKFQNDLSYTPEKGESKAHTYHWLCNMNALGKINPGISANIPTFAVFSQPGINQYVVYNYGAAPVTVRFSDGFAMEVPARNFNVASLNVIKSFKKTGTPIRMPGVYYSRQMEYYHQLFPYAEMYSPLGRRIPKAKNMTTTPVIPMPVELK